MRKRSWSMPDRRTVCWTRRRSLVSSEHSIGNVTSSMEHPQCSRGWGCQPASLLQSVLKHCKVWVWCSSRRVDRPSWRHHPGRPTSLLPVTGRGLSNGAEKDHCQGGECRVVEDIWWGAQQGHGTYGEGSILYTFDRHIEPTNVAGVAAAFDNKYCKCKCSTRASAPAHYTQDYHVGDMPPGCIRKAKKSYFFSGLQSVVNGTKTRCMPNHQGH